MGQGGVGDVCLVGGVVDDHRAMPVGVVHPCLQARTVDDGTRGVVGEAQVDDRDVCVGGGKVGHEAVLLRAGHVHHVAPQAGFLVVGAGAACHDVRVNVDGVHRVAHRDARIGAEYLLDVGGIGLRAVAHEHFVGVDGSTARDEVLARDGLAQEVVAQVGGVASERARAGHLVHCAVERAHDRGREGLGHVADAQAHDARGLVGVLLAVCVDLGSHRGEQVVPRELEVVLVCLEHGFPPRAVGWGAALTSRGSPRGAGCRAGMRTRRSGPRRRLRRGRS